MIDSYTFGTFVIDGEKFDSNIVLIDYKPKKGRYLEGHLLQQSDFDDLIAAKPDIIIIGTGESGVVQVQEEIIQMIKSKGIKLIIEKTKDAIKIYNDLIKKNKKVCAFMHNTC